MAITITQLDSLYSNILKFLHGPLSRMCPLEAQSITLARWSVKPISNSSAPDHKDSKFDVNMAELTKEKRIYAGH